MNRILIIIIAFISASCLKLDSNMYNVSDKITEYKLDNYTGEQDFILDASYNLPAAYVTQFTLNSKNKEGKDVEIYAIYIGDMAKIATDTVILYCHGNKWHMDFYWQRAKLLAHVNGKNRYGVLMMDYQGYGLSKGIAEEQAIYNDVSTCIDWLKLKGLTSGRLMMYGFSLGSAPACELTAHPGSLSPAKLILEAPFASAAVLEQDASQLNMPAEYFTDLKLDNAEEIKLVNQPFLWIHGDNDNFVGYKTHGQVVYNNYAGTYKEKFLVAGADHGEVPEKMGFEKYLEVAGTFIRR